MKKITLIALLFISSLTFSQELLLNGGFEKWSDATSPAGFSKVENIEQESTADNVHSGTYSAKHTGGTNDLGQTVSVTPGHSYTISLWYKVETGDGTDARIWSYWKNNGSNINDNASELRGPDNSYFDNNGGVWTEYKTTITAPATATDLYFEVRTYSGAITYWDDFSVVDNDGASITNTSVSFTATSSDIEENVGTVDVCVSITNPDATNATTVELNLNGASTTTNGSDYSTVTFPQTITFPAGSSADQCFTFTITDDADLEDTETIVLDLQNPAGGNSTELGIRTQHTVTISKNDDGTTHYTFVSADYDKVATDLSGDADLADKISNLSSFRNFDRRTTGSSGWSDNELLKAFDIILKDKFPSAATGHKFTVTIDIYDGSNGTEEFIIQLNSDGDYEYETAPITSVSFTTTSSSVSESVGTVDVCVSIINPDATNATTVELNLNGASTTTNGSDYSTVTFPQTITFPAGSSADQCFTFTITDDTDEENAETIVLNLENPAGGNSVALGAITQHTINIQDNDTPDTIFITEVMQNPSAVNDSAGEWFEIHNATDSTIDLNGWIVADESTESENFTIESLTIDAGEYLLFALNGTAAENGGLPNVDYVYSGISLGNSTDGIVIKNTEGTIIDEVTWDNGSTFPDPSGASMSLKITKLSSLNNDSGANWEAASLSYGDGDLGTPGLANDDDTLGFTESKISGLVISSSNGTIEVNKGDVLVVYNILGLEVKNADLTTGIYIVMVKNGAITTTEKVLVK